MTNVSVRIIITCAKRFCRCWISKSCSVMIQVCKTVRVSIFVRRRIKSHVAHHNVAINLQNSTFMLSIKTCIHIIHLRSLTAAESQNTHAACYMATCTETHTAYIHMSRIGFYRIWEDTTNLPSTRKKVVSTTYDLLSRKMRESKTFRRFMAFKLLNLGRTLSCIVSNDADFRALSSGINYS